MRLIGLDMRNHDQNDSNVCKNSCLLHNVLRSTKHTRPISATTRAIPEEGTQLVSLRQRDGAWRRIAAWNPLTLRLPKLILRHVGRGCGHAHVLFLVLDGTHTHTADHSLVKA